VTDEIIKDFDKFIEELTGPTGVSKKVVRNVWRELQNIEEFIEYRKELDELIGNCHCDRFKCGKCGEYYEIYLEPNKIDKLDWTTNEPFEIIMDKRERYYCMICGSMIQTIGKIKFVRNVCSLRKMEMNLGE